MVSVTFEVSSKSVASILSETSPKVSTTASISWPAFEFSGETHVTPWQAILPFRRISVLLARPPSPLCPLLLSINVTFTFYFLLFVDMFRPHTAIFKCYNILSRSWCSVMQFFPMLECQPHAPADGVLIVSVRVLEYLCCLCGCLVACGPIVALLPGMHLPSCSIAMTVSTRPPPWLPLLCHRNVTQYTCIYSVCVCAHMCICVCVQIWRC
jgi:hypothetical protein